MSVRLSETLVTTEPLADAFSDAVVLAAMLRFEVALARAEARVGVVPASTADAITAAATADPFDVSAIARDARASGTMAIPFVDALRSRVRARDPGAATFVHFGATSQDVSDTALVLCVARAAALLLADHERLIAGLRRLSDAHAGTVMLARTLMQPAPPVTFGLKAAGWFGAVDRCGERLKASLKDACVLQFGGATGTLAALGHMGPRVAEDLARELDLPLPDAPWHAHRDRLAALVAACGVYTGSLGKIARDISLLMQFEVAEAAEPGGGSSTMPHKRNPAGCAIALAASVRMPGLVSSFLTGMSQEHERGLGGWHAEWSTVAAIVQTVGSALDTLTRVVESIDVDPRRMRANIAATGGAVFAERAVILLSRSLGRDAAGRIVADALETARRDGRSFASALSATSEAAAVLTADELLTLDQPEDYLGSAERFRRRLLRVSDE
jgi:3-carboxy-cis,cis-muconate cycloisomerase